MKIVIGQILKPYQLTCLFRWCPWYSNTIVGDVQINGLYSENFPRHQGSGMCTYNTMYSILLCTSYVETKPRKIPTLLIFALEEAIITWSTRSKFILFTNSKVVRFKSCKPVSRFPFFGIVAPEGRVV